MAAATKFSHIAPLPDLLVDKIAAGEVIEGPASVVKECLENAVDSGATRLKISTEQGGMERIEIQDNGSGIFFADLPLAIMRHATSKIRSLADLEEIGSMGFRGEALAAIAAVAELSIQTRQESETAGGFLLARGGAVLECKEVAHPGGTTLTVRDLFFSVPARKKFQKAEKTSNLQIYQEILKIALAHPQIQIQYIRDQREYLFLPAHPELRDRLKAIYGKEIEPHLISCSAQVPEFQVSGFLCSGDYFRPRTDRQYTFINKRAVEIKAAGMLIKKAYGELLPPGAYPCFFLYLEFPAPSVDVNVHPAKKEVRLLHQSQLNGVLMQMVHSALHKENPVSLAQKSQHIRSAPAALPQLFPRTGVLPAREYQVALSQSSALEDLAAAPPSLHDDPATIPDREENEIHRVEFLKHAGRIFGTYILAEARDGFYFVDQHTAHERINYEKMRRRFAELKHQKQLLLEPRILRCARAEVEEIEPELSTLAANGFVLEVFGEDSFVVREIPGYIDPGTEEAILWHLIGRILQGETGFALYDELAAMKACKASIKKNDAISGDVISGILEELSACAEPLRCPHGRPTMIRVTQEELDRMFMRI